MKNILHTINAHLYRAILVGITVASVGIIGVNVFEVESEVVIVSFASLMILSTFLGVVYGVQSGPRAAQIYVLCIVLFALSILLKRVHFAGTGPILILSLFVPMLILLSQVVTAPIRQRGNAFLMGAAMIGSLFLPFAFWVFISKLQHWPGGDYLTIVLAPSFVILTVLLLIGIQLSDIVSWPVHQRDFLMRNILMPWAFTFFLGCTLILFSDQYWAMVDSTMVWNMPNYEIQN